MNQINNFLNNISTNEILKQNTLSNRELAYLTIIILGVVIVFIQHKDRKGLLLNVIGILKVIFSKKILGTTVILVAWVVFNCYILKEINIWNYGLIKSTSIWFITTGIFIVFKVVQLKEDEILQYLKSILFNSIKITIILEFIQGIYVWDYWIELLVGIFLIIFALIQVVVELNKDTIKLQKIIDKVLMIVGIAWVISLLYEITTQPKELIALNNLREFASTIILTISMIVPTYCLGIYAKYENIFIRLKMRGNIDNSTKRYIKFRIILYAKLNPKKLDFRIYQNIFWLSDKSDIKKAFKDLKNEVALTSN